MYYNKFVNKLILDGFDYSIISFLIVFYLSKYSQFYFSEEQKIERLRQDIIKKSKLIESSSQPTILQMTTLKGH
jgi:hypothetical protein